MEIVINIQGSKNLSQSSLISKNLYSTVSIGVRETRNAGVEASDCFLPVEDGDTYLVLTLVNGLTRTVMYKRRVPLDAITSSDEAMWLAVFKPGDPRDETFDRATVPRQDAPQVQVTLSRIQRGGSVTDPPAQGMCASPLVTIDCGSNAAIPRDSLVASSIAIKEKEKQAQDIKSQFSVLAGAQAQAQTDQQRLRDLARSIDEMRVKVEQSEQELVKLTAARSAAEREMRHAEDISRQAREALRLRDFSIQDLRKTHDQADEQLAQITQERDEQRASMDHTLRKFEQELADKATGVDKLRLAANGLSDELQRCDRQVQELQEASGYAPEARASMAKHQALRDQIEEARNDLEAARQLASTRAAKLSENEAQCEEARRRVVEVEAAAKKAMQRTATEEATEERERDLQSMQYRAEAAAAEKELMVHMARAATLEGMVGENRIQLRELEARLRELHEDLARNATKQDLTETAIVELRGHIDSKTKEGETDQEQAVQLRSKMQQVRDALDKSRRRVIESEQAQRDQDAETTRRVEELDATLRSVKGEVDTFTGKVAQLRSDRAAAEAQVRAAASEEAHRKTEQQLADLSRELEQETEVNRQLVALDDAHSLAVGALQERLRVRQAELGASKDGMASKQAEAARLREVLETKETTKKSRTTDVRAKLEEQAARLHAESQELHTMQEQRTDLEGRREKAAQSCKDAQARLENILAASRRAADEREEQLRQFASEISKHESEEHEHNARHSELEGRLRQLESGAAVANGIDVRPGDYAGLDMHLDTEAAGAGASSMQDLVHSLEMRVLELRKEIGSCESAASESEALASASETAAFHAIDRSTTDLLAEKNAELDMRIEAIDDMERKVLHLTCLIEAEEGRSRDLRESRGSPTSRRDGAPSNLLDVLWREQQTLHDKREPLETAIQQATEKLQITQDSIETLTSKVSALASDVAKAEAELASDQDDHAIKVDEVARLTSAIKHKKVEKDSVVGELEQEIKAARGQLDGLMAKAAVDTRLVGRFLLPESQGRAQLLAAQADDLADALAKAKSEVHESNVRNDALRRDVVQLREQMNVVEGRMQHSIDQGSLQFASIEHLEMENRELEDAAELLTLNLHEAKTQGDYLQQENDLIRKKVDGVYEGSLQDWIQEVGRIKVEAEIEKNSGELSHWKQVVVDADTAWRDDIAKNRNKHAAEEQTLQNSLRAVSEENARYKDTVSALEEQLSTVKSTLHAVPSSLHAYVAIAKPVQKSDLHLRRALIIGCNYWSSHAPLAGCVNDAWNMQTFLRLSLQYPEEQVRCLVDGSRMNPSLPTLQPTQRNIMDGLNWLFSKASPADNLFLYWSGYGSRQKLRHPDGTWTWANHIVPSDFADNLPAGYFQSPDAAATVTPQHSYRLIALAEIRKAIVKLPKGCKVTLIFDSCHGAFSDVANADPVPEAITPSRAATQATKVRSLDLPQLAATPITPHVPISMGPTACSCQIYSACGAERSSCEFRIEGCVQGAFTWACVKAVTAGHSEINVHRFMQAVRYLLVELRKNSLLVNAEPIACLCGPTTLQDPVLVR